MLLDRQLYEKLEKKKKELDSHRPLAKAVLEELRKQFEIELTYNSNAIEDLYTLSLCDVIIGSNSSFGNFAAYYGNKPHIVLQKETMDWEYYKDRDAYFENKYSVMSV